MLYIIYNIHTGIEVGSFTNRGEALSFMDQVGTMDHALASHGGVDLG